MNKKAQTISIIILVLILIISAIIIFSLSTQEEIQTDQTEQIIEQHLNSCSNEITQSFINRALRKGGYGEYPTNTIRTQQKNYVLSYSPEGLMQGLPTKDQTQLFLKTELRAMMYCAQALIRQDEELRWTELKTITPEVQIKEHEIQITYTYEYKENNQERTEKKTKTYKTNLGYFLDKANEVTNTILEKRETTQQQKEELCEEIKKETTQKPTYSLAFLTQLSTDPEIKFMFEKDFFVINIEREQETFVFAIQPEQEPTC